jgi:hypothetical protein
MLIFINLLVLYFVAKVILIMKHRKGRGLMKELIGEGVNRFLSGC